MPQNTCSDYIALLPVAMETEFTNVENLKEIAFEF